ncbi:MAG: hypothetical protein ACI8P3_001663, partial [Saprospiraceae bacterium]
MKALKLLLAAVLLIGGFFLGTAWKSQDIDQSKTSDKTIETNTQNAQITAKFVGNDEESKSFSL